MAAVEQAYDSYASATKTPQDRQVFWMANIKLAEKELSKFHARGNKIIAQYVDERGHSDLAGVEHARKFNLFHSNVNILKAAFYSKLPTPEVVRRFKDQDDDVARVAAKILERNLEYELQMDRDCDEVIKSIVLDRLIPGMGVAWCRYEADTQRAQAEGADIEVITDEQTPLEYVYWEDLLWSPARTWRDVWWLARRVYLTRDEGVRRFGDKFKSVPLDKSTTKGETGESSGEMLGPKHEGVKKACVYEIWDKKKRQVLWVAKGLSEPLEEKDDFLGLQGFFPTPKPLMASYTTSNLVPWADYLLCQDQYEELNHINTRISFLVQACKVVGVYDKTAEGTQRMLQQGIENQLIPVDQWAAFAEKGGLKGVVDWLPVEHVINVISQLNMAREVIKQQIYELTGLSDIIRGASVASETAAAQKIKAQYASVRLSTQQNEVARFLMDLFDIKATLMCKFYQPEKLLKQAGTFPPEDQQLIPPALELLKTGYNDKFRLVVTVDTFTDVEWQREQEERMAFLQNASQFIEKASTAVQGAPEVAPMMFGLLKFAVAGFRTSRDVEGIIDNGMNSMMQAIQQKSQQPPEPSPEMMKVQAQVEGDKAKLQFEQAKGQAQLALEQARAQADIEIEKQRLAMEREKMLFEMQLEREKMLFEMQLEREKHAAEMQIRAMDAQQDMAIKAQTTEHDMALNEVKAEQAAEQQKEKKALAKE